MLQFKSANTAVDLSCYSLFLQLFLLPFVSSGDCIFCSVLQHILKQRDLQASVQCLEAGEHVHEWVGWCRGVRASPAGWVMGEADIDRVPKAPSRPWERAQLSGGSLAPCS